MSHEVLFDLARENAERGYYVLMLKDLPDKVAIIDHYRFVEGWRARRDRKLFYYIRFGDCKNPARLKSVYGITFDTKTPELSGEELHFLESKGVVFKKCEVYSQLKCTEIFMGLGT